MNRLLLGVIGHVDHGKTALVRALTGQDTDRLPEEKQRGISIALGFAHLAATPDSEIDLIDMPGHEDFVRTMISGATGIDAVLLVVAANEGIKPQTVEHIDIAGLLGVRRAVVAISKADLVPPDEATLVAEEVSELLARAGIATLPPVITSAVQGLGMDEVRATLATLAAGQQARSDDGISFLPLDRAFAIAGHGPVVTGTLRGGAITTGDTLELLPSRKSVRVRAVQVHGAKVERALPGQRVALNLRDVEMGELKRGMALATPDALSLSPWLTVSIRSVAGAPPLKNGMRLRALMGTDEVEVRLRLLDRDILEPGESGFAQLHGTRPVALPAGEHVILRLISPSRTVAGGAIIEPVGKRLKRNAPEILDRLAELHRLPPAERIAAEIARAGKAGTNIRQLARLSAFSGTRMSELLHALPVTITRSGSVVRHADVEQLATLIPPLLAPQMLGLTHDRLRAALPGVSAAAIDVALAQLLASGAIAKRGGQYLIPRPEEERARARDEADLAASISAMLQQGGLTPPGPSAILIDPPSQRAVDRLIREGTVIRAVDRDKRKEILFHHDAIEHAQRMLAPLLEQGQGLLVTEIAAALGISRKYCMPLLDHLDTIRFTRRINDRRMLAKLSSSLHQES